VAAFTLLTLEQLFQSIPVRVLGADELPPIPVTGIVFDSRQVKPGNLYVALVGEYSDGHDFINAAAESGAAVAVGTASSPSGIDIPYIQVENSRFALAHLSAAIHGFPARRLTVIGVTGTDGKTTTANLIFQILKQAGLQAGIISTVSAVIGKEVVDTGFHVTTPSSVEMQALLARMVDEGLTHVVLETTSHGLVQHRATACEFDIAVVTNITHEHLDYHGSFEKYRAAKGMLFEALNLTLQKPSGNPRMAVLNLDDRLSFEYLREVSASAQWVNYSIEDPGASIRAEEIKYRPDGASFTALLDGEAGAVRFPVRCHLPGSYNVSNCLAAIGATVVGLGLPAEAAQEGIVSLEALIGRMQRFDLGQDFTAIVDFAHTPNALRNALKSAREMTTGRLIAVFGSAGLRDRQKRRLMAEISIDLADLTILTAEDPRTELLEDILSEMAAAAAGKGGEENKNFWRVYDRSEAIRTALQKALPGDLVIVCGKGHEQSMCFGKIEYPWDDGIALQAALAELLNVPGPKMPYLPTQE
jgi:UDP-N-acetylmuramoyl-L-alanyl-D-glutamate--2,6-diaminopimelate ligase